MSNLSSISPPRFPMLQQFEADGGLERASLSAQLGVYSGLCCLANPEVQGILKAWILAFGVDETVRLVNYCCLCNTGVKQ
jgi:hypothetical protein